MPQDNVRFQVGSTLQLQPLTGDGALRFAVRVVGCLTGASLIVTAPLVNGKVALVRDNARFTVRQLRGHRVEGFVATVLHYAAKPFPHLHLSYPKEIESVVVRNAQRASCQLPTIVHNATRVEGDSEPTDAMMVDLSVSGARIASHVAVGDVGDMLRLSFPLRVAGVEETLALVADIRNHIERHGAEAEVGRHLYGVQFRSTNRYQLVLMHAFVLEHLLSGDYDF